MIEANDQRTSLLLVDDDRSFCAALEAALDARGFDVRIAHSVSQASELAARDHPPMLMILLRRCIAMWAIPTHLSRPNRFRSRVLNGNTSSACGRSVAATYPRPPDGSGCTDARCKEN